MSSWKLSTVKLTMTVTYNIKIKIKEATEETAVPTDAAVSPERDETDSTLLEIEEIGKTLEAFDTQQLLPPIQRYKKKNKLSVTDFSAQLWCEQQLEFTLTTGRKRETEAMKSGTARHEALERADHDIVDVEVETREENLALRLLNGINLLDLLYEKGKSREVWVFGIFEDVLVRGVIDELSLVRTPDGRRELLLSDTKTRRQESEPSPAQKTHVSDSTTSI